MIDLTQMQILTAAVVLALLWALESMIPFLPNRRQRLRHAARNITIGAVNAIALVLLFSPLFVYVAAWNEAHNFGLLRFIELPVYVSAMLAILVQDALMYVWHRANHRFPLLWRFHKVHHSDPEMDASTAVRFHTGEILISAILRLGVIAVLGLSLWQVLLYDLLLVPVIMFHHSNVQFPENWDKLFRASFASPMMHRIHHSPIRIETDSNYGSIFSFWDRLAGSFRRRENLVEVKYGISEYTGNQTESFPVLALMPFQKPALPLSKQAKEYENLIYHQ